MIFWSQDFAVEIIHRRLETSEGIQGFKLSPVATLSHPLFYLIYFKFYFVNSVYSINSLIYTIY